MQRRYPGVHLPEKTRYSVRTAPVGPNAILCFAKTGSVVKNILADRLYSISPRNPAPEKAESLPMPGDDGFWPNRQQSLPPIGPDS